MRLHKSGSERLSQLSKVLFKPSSRRGVLAMLAAYLDGSGTDERSKYVVVAGFVAPVDKWVEFEGDWSQLLRSPRYQLEYAHARKLASLGAVKRDTFYHEANYLLKRTVSFAVAATIKKADYSAAFQKNYPLTVKDAIYPLAFRAAMVAICKHVPESYPGETVAFLIESGDPNQGGAKNIFDLTALASAAYAEVRKDYPIETLTIADKRDFGALQVSDMHAYSKLKHQESKYRERPDQSHPLISMLLSDLNFAHFDLTKSELLNQREIAIAAHKKRKLHGQKKYGTKAKIFPEF